ncbi:MAG: tryptophan--tRNA ligase [Candidatus Moraniibacteriota bacterium]|nr:MAG: tryptophan--tRNA ligase [Candidatus Moranbacteria bacterium]
MEKQRIFSGIQPSGNLHIGNYLGAIKQWVELQEAYDAIFCVVDLHAITVPQNPEELRRRTIEIAKIYIAAGIDPNRSTLFVQSHVREHTELGWILNTIARMGELERMTQYKDKSQKGESSSSGVGLFTYPTLMAADILLYDTAVVPVGKDQMQHVELARDIAERFNGRFGETFIVPEGKLSKQGALIMGLDNPAKKMSKSASSEYNYIALMDDPEAAKKKIMKAVTDSGAEILYADDKPALKNLINIYSLLGGVSTDEVVARYAGKGYADFKRDLADVVAEFLAGFQEKFRALSDDDTLRILHSGAERARAIAERKMLDVREKIGLVTG